jgi:hypothetical protein
LSAARGELAAVPAAARFTCTGAPRDLGRQQGIVCSPELQRGFRAESWLVRARAHGPRRGGEARLARDLWRHFPHQAERLQALARAAHVPEGWLVRQLAAELRGSPAASAIALVPAGGVPVLAAWFGAALRLRESRPDGRYASLEWCAAGATSARLGVNERGLAVAVLSQVGAGELALPHRDAEVAPEAPRCAAPATLLAQDCLENFERLEPAVEWCLARPAGGMARILIADREGYAAAIDVAFGARSLRWFEGEPIVAARWPEDAESIAKILAAPDPDADRAALESSAWLARILASGVSARAACVDPRERRAGWLEAAGDGDPTLAWKELAPTPDTGAIR